MVAPPAKRSCPKEVHEEPIINALPTSIPHPDAAGSSNAPAVASSVRMETRPTQDGAPDGPAPVEEDLDQKDAPSSIPPPIWEEMMEMLRRVPCFTNTELLSTKMSAFFPFTKWVSVSLVGDSPTSVTARFSLGTPKFVVSHIQLLQDCTAQETTKVVSS